jgi:hypothetical protein
LGYFFTMGRENNLFFNPIHPQFALIEAGGGDRKEAILQTAASLGSVVLARAVHDSTLNNEILESVR